MPMPITPAFDPVVRFLTRSACILAVALIAACAGPAAAESGPTGADARTFQSLVDTLAAPEMEGRGPGTEGIERARDFIIEQFVDAGLEPAFNAAGEGGEGGEGGEADPLFTQTLTIPLDWDLEKAHLAFAADADAGEQDAGASATFEHGEDYRVMAGIAMDARMLAATTFIGYGVVNERHNYSSFQRNDRRLPRDALDGRIAIAFRYEPMDDAGRSRWGRRGQWSQAARLSAKARHAANHGAAALLFVNPPSHPDADAGMLRPLSPVGGRGADIPVLQISQAAFARILRAAGYDDPDAVARRWQRRADTGTLEPIDLDESALDVRIGITRQRVDIDNVAAALPGRGELAGQWVIVGAHYDHLGYGGFGSREPGVEAIHPGADDNASGVAAILMMARAMTVKAAEADEPGDEAEGGAADDAAGEQARGRRSVMFIAFSGEERGLLGSSYLARNLQRDTGIDPADVVAMVNLDMVGRKRPRSGLIISGTGTSDLWPQLIDATEQRHRIRLTTRSMAVGGSDHVPFMRRNIPVLFLNTGLHEDYHRTTDTADRINAEGGAAIAAFTNELVWQLAHHAEGPRFTRPRPRGDAADAEDADADAAAEPGRDGPRIGRVRLGIMPDYAREGPGVAIDTIAPDTAAAEAGLQPGDILRAWNGEPIDTLEALTGILAGHAPGDRVELTIDRDGRQHQVEVTLGAR